MINDSACFWSIANPLKVNEQITQNEAGGRRGQRACRPEYVPNSCVCIFVHTLGPTRVGFPAGSLCL